MSALPGRRQGVGLLGWFALCFVAAGIGALASVDAAAFYARLAQPAWAPPAAVFGPVWTTLYALMAIAAWLVWRRAGWRDAHRALSLFVIQLAVNALWSWLFFVWHLGAPAFVGTLALWGLIAATLIAFWRKSRLAGVLLVPYLAWVSLATALTWAVWQANPGLLGLA
ncbi:TspO/MBR family protein [Modicisalibacter coralii]|uniref:TspO/MBR family protein n=1 Tax=Modicisalibacter coralii TaxID=2304602 RepID=UPI00100A8F6E|nr:TspO/MBR family protein [Halomonas coralii]